MDTGVVGIKPPPSPSKWDIIPIHTSDRATFKFCRRQWSWSSPAKLNLVPKASVHGIRLPLWFGTGIHHALERYYNPTLRHDPNAEWEAWYQLQWRGGLVHEQELKQFVDRKPTITHMPGVYAVNGLSELLPDPDPEVFEAHRVLGHGMLNYYKEYAEREDNFSVIMVEHDFSVPIPDLENNDILRMHDNRTMPEDYELNTQYGVWETYNMGLPLKEVHARGRMDAVVQDNDTGQYGIIDHKTAATIGDDYFRHLDLDEQCTTYAWAAEREAAIYDLEYRKIDFVVYNVLRKAYPTPPTMTSRGLPSIDRQKESTTAALFEKCIKENGLQIIFDGDNKTSLSLQNYYSYLVEMGDKLFIQRDIVRRNAAQKENCGRRLYYEAKDMLGDPVPYPNPSKNYSCINCIFRSPCVAMESGYDWQNMLEDGYESNYDR